MVIVGIDAHKRSHTAVAVDEAGRKLGQRTTGTTSEDHLVLLNWVEQFGDERLWAIEDCRHLSRRLERDLLGAGERIVRVPTKLMAVARAALREPDLPTAQFDGPAREVRLLSDHRDHLVAERTRVINRLRWHLHELDPGNEPPARHPVATQTSQPRRGSTRRVRRHRRTLGDRPARSLPPAHRADSAARS